MNSTPVLPTSTPADAGVRSLGSVGFKDWAVVCDALGGGRQSIILRKGGIAEGRDGFRFKHERFFLFPTQYHQQFERVRPETAQTSRTTAVPHETVEIRYFFALDFALWVDDWQKLARLEPFHIWKEDVVRERFDYEAQRGLQCAFGRVCRCSDPWTFPNRPSYSGCRSWVTLPEAPADLRPEAVLEESEHQRRRQEIGAILGHV